MSEEYYLTTNGRERLQAELENLKGPARQEIAKRLRAAIQMGDLSENADYHAAKESQAFLEGRIQEIEHLLQNSILIDESIDSRDIIELGAYVTFQEGEEPPETYQIVGAKEADPRQGRISNESPFGSAILGKRVGDEVEARTPAGTVRLKILEIK
ncbi:MAG: transcription elongation factor GreA [Anaerolineales bacterium]|nr:transcription elongation factor GreA [Anaerolineales bacterium]